MTRDKHNSHWTQMRMKMNKNHVLLYYVKIGYTQFHTKSKTFVRNNFKLENISRLLIHILKYKIITLQSRIIEYLNV